MTNTLQTLILAAIILCSTTVWAQTETDNAANQVLQKINEALSQDDCDKAQLSYNQWKALTNSTNSSVESRIKNCQSKNLDKLANQTKQKIVEALLQGDCDKAQRNYYIWKDLTAQTNLVFEAEIKDCKNDTEKEKPIQSQTETKTYKKGDLKIGQEFQGGRIVYLDKSGIHGWIVTITDVTQEAVCWSTANETCQKLTLGGNTNWRLPSRNELEIILKNKKLFGMYSEYWSSTYCYRYGDSHYTNNGCSSIGGNHQVRAIREF